MADEAVRYGAIDLAQGVLHTEPPKVLIDLLSELITEPRVHTYSSPQGIPAYLESLENLLATEGTPVSKTNLLGSSGNTGGLLAVLIAHCSAGDRVILPEPFYPAHLWAIRAARCEPVFVGYNERFTPNEAELLQLLPTARAVILCNPSNPSGAVWEQTQLEQLLRAAHEHGTLVIADETYKDYIWEGLFTSPLSLGTDWQSFVVLRGFSKTLAIAGWRIGYAISSPERIQAMTHQIHDALYVGAPSLPQHVLARALRDHHEELRTFVQRNVALYRETRLRLADVFRSIGMEPLLPHGAFYMLVKHNRQSDIAATKELLAAGVAVAPGQAFFHNPTAPSGHIRIHFAVAPETVEEVRKRLTTQTKN